MSGTKSSRKKDRRRAAGWADGEHEKAEKALPSVRLCACCDSAEPRTRHGWVADHDHVTGLFRGHTCHPCNVIIGWHERHPQIERSNQVRLYLERSRSLDRDYWNHLCGDFNIAVYLAAERMGRPIPDREQLSCAFGLFLKLRRGPHPSGGGDWHKDLEG